jgi:GTPase SAR1 family protein
VQVIRPCSQLQQSEILQIARSFYCGNLIITGAGGTGKTTVVLQLIEAAILKKERPIIGSANNKATNNIAERAQAERVDNNRLFVRFYADHLETAVMRRFKPSTPGQVPQSSSSKRQSDNFCWNLSLAKRILELCSIIPTSNEKILKLRETDSQVWDEMASVIRTPVHERSDDQKNFIRTRTKYARVAILDIADTVFTTPIATTSKWMRSYMRSTRLAIIDEAGATTMADVFLMWDGDDCALILVGDPTQLPPTIMTAIATYLNGRPTNGFAAQVGSTMMTDLLSNDRPYWRLREQLRVEPGQWDLPNLLSYHGEISVPPIRNLSKQAQDFENFAVSLGRGEVTRAPAALRIPCYSPSRIPLPSLRPEVSAGPTVTLWQLDFGFSCISCVPVKASRLVGLELSLLTWHKQISGERPSLITRN